MDHVDHPHYNDFEVVAGGGMDAWQLSPHVLLLHLTFDRSDQRQDLTFQEAAEWHGGRAELAALPMPYNISIVLRSTFTTVLIASWWNHSVCVSCGRRRKMCKCMTGLSGLKRAAVTLAAAATATTRKRHSQMLSNLTTLNTWTPRFSGSQ